MKTQFQSHRGFATPTQKQEPDFVWLLNDPIYMAMSKVVDVFMENGGKNENKN